MEPGTPVLHFFSGRYHHATIGANNGNGTYVVYYENEDVNERVDRKYLYTYLDVGQRVTYRTSGGEFVPAVIMNFNERTTLYTIELNEGQKKYKIRRRNLLTCEEMDRNVHVECGLYDSYFRGVSNEEGHARIRQVITRGSLQDRNKLINSIKKCIEIRKNFISECLYQSQPINRVDFWNQIIHSIDHIAAPQLARRSPTSRQYDMSMYRDVFYILQQQMGRDGLFYNRALRERNLPVDLTGYAQPDFNHEWTIYLLWRYIEEYGSQEEKEEKSMRRQEQEFERIEQAFLEKQASDAAATALRAQSWTCNSCTYINDKMDAPVCEMCESFREEAPRAPDRSLTKRERFKKAKELERELREVDAQIAALSLPAPELQIPEDDDPAYRHLTPEQREMIFKAIGRSRK